MWREAAPPAQSLFVEVGLGKLQIKEVKPFEFVFKIENSPVTKMFETGRKSCYITVDAIRMFFEMDLNIPSKVIETKCKNGGDEYCEFEVQMQPIAIYKAALGEKDVEILKSILKRKKIENEEDKIRIEYLKKYKILDNSEKITDIGKTYIRYIESIGIEKDLEKPWKKLSEVSEIIASSRSFAEAFASSSLQDVEKIDEEKVINLVDEAKKSKSFAELVSKEFKEVDE